MLHKKKLLAKILLFIGVPIAVIFVILAVIITQTVKQSVSQLTTSDLTSKSQAASYQINNYFSKYTTIVGQMKLNTVLQKYLQNTSGKKDIKEVAGFAEIEQIVSNITASDKLATNKNNIVDTWIADTATNHIINQTNGTAPFTIENQPWNNELKESGTTFITEPYENTLTKKMTISVIAPLFSNSGNMSGAAGIDISLDTLYDTVAEYKLGNGGFYMLTSKKGQLVYHPDKKLKNTSITESSMSKDIIGAMQSKKASFLSYTAMNQTNYGYVSPIGATGWTVATGLPESEFNSTYRSVLTSVLLIFAIALLILVSLIIIVSKSIVNPLIKLKKAANQIADGNLDVSIKVKSKDEVGQVSAALTRTVVRLKQYIAYINEVSATLDQIADGNLIFELQCDYTGEFAKIKDSLENIKMTLILAFTEINDSAAQVASGSNQVASASKSLAEGSTKQASSVDQLSESITEIANQVKQNAVNAENASNLSAAASIEIANGNELMRQMTVAMTDISTSSSQIRAIIKTIDDIAFQTNILALNAAVEAARAGSAGKGFAVVADEVRNLASKSAEAAKDTTALIESAIQSVQHGTKIANETAKSLNAIIASNDKSSALIKEISQACGEQTTAIQQVTMGVDQISAVVQTNSATSEETAASSEELNEQAQMLTMLVQQFKIKEDDEVILPDEAVFDEESMDTEVQANEIEADDKYAVRY